LSIAIILIGICAEYFFVSILLAIREIRVWPKSHNSHDSASVTQAFLEYAAYCKPMIWMSIFAFIYEIADRWMLQHFSGSVQQGFYQITLQLSTISLLAATSMLNVFWKEIAEANERGQHASVIMLYENATRLLVIFGAGIACFLLPWSRELTIVLLGKEYYPAWPALMIMLLYPIHQVMGQINGTLFMAIGETKIYTRLANIGLIISIPISYLLLAPSSGLLVSGFGLGAFGLAIKIVFLNMIFVNIQSYFIARKYLVPMQWAVQFKAILSFSIVGFLTYILIGGDDGGLTKISLIWRLILSGSIYIVGVVFISLWRPSLIGLKNSDIAHLQDWVAVRFGGRSW
jgi:O-antigen/teichoic acid export membrane protein